jgi:hypothetical protein
MATFGAIPSDRTVGTNLLSTVQTLTVADSGDANPATSEVITKGGDYCGI